MRRAVAFVVGAWVAIAPELAHAACGARTWIEVHADELLGRDVATHVVGELRADLATQDIDVCDAAGTTPPAARVSIVLSNAPESVAIRIAVRDAVTAKDLSRTLDTSKIPPEGRALVIALATEELLRASWAEIALPSAPPPAITVPAPVARIVVASIRAPPPAPAKPPRAAFVMGFDAVADAFTTGLFRFGGDVRAGFEIGRRFGVFAFGGFRRSPATASIDGTVDADTLLAGVDASFALVPRPRRVGMDVVARFEIARTTFRGTPLPGNGGASTTLTSIDAAFGARARVSIISSLDVALTLLAGFPILAANAHDGDAVVASTDGALFTASLGVLGRFR